MIRNEYISPAIDAVRRMLQMLRSQVNNIAEVDIAEVDMESEAGLFYEFDTLEELTRSIPTVQQLLFSLEETINLVAESKGKEDDMKAAFQLITAANELSAEFDWLTNMLQYGVGHPPADQNRNANWVQSLPSIHAILNKIKSLVVPSLKMFLSRIWSLIAKLLTPKEWKLKGDVNASVLGLANVGIEITFGQ